MYEHFKLKQKYSSDHIVLGIFSNSRQNIFPIYCVMRILFTGENKRKRSQISELVSVFETVMFCTNTIFCNWCCQYQFFTASAYVPVNDASTYFWGTFFNIYPACCNNVTIRWFRCVFMIQDVEND